MPKNELFATRFYGSRRQNFSTTKIYSRKIHAHKYLTLCLCNNIDYFALCIASFWHWCSKNSLTKRSKRSVNLVTFFAKLCLSDLLDHATFSVIFFWCVTWQIGQINFCNKKFVFKLNTDLLVQNKHQEHIATGI